MKPWIVGALVLAIVAAAAWMWAAAVSDRFAMHRPDSRIPDVLPVYVINLKDRPDRWRACEENLGSLDAFPIVRIEAVDGRALDPSTLPPDRTRGEVACFHSHLEALRRIAEARFPYGIVVEDDVDMPLARAAPAIRTAMEDAPAGWQALCLGANHVQPSSTHVGRGLVKLGGDLYGAHAILYAKETARTLLDATHNLGCPWDFWVHGALGRMFVAHPAIARTRAGGDSSTQSIR
jgi:hypothetical protein